VIPRQPVPETRRKVPTGLGSVGLYIWNQTARTSCNGMIVEDNVISNRKPDGTFNDYWNSGNCGPVVESGNVFGSAARALLTPEPTPPEMPGVP
jgi:hypothetical protein